MYVHDADYSWEKLSWYWDLLPVFDDILNKVKVGLFSEFISCWVSDFAEAALFESQIQDGKSLNRFLRNLIQMTSNKRAIFYLGKIIDVAFPCGLIRDDNFPDAPLRISSNCYRVDVSWLVNCRERRQCVEFPAHSDEEAFDKVLQAYLDNDGKPWSVGRFIRYENTQDSGVSVMSSFEHFAGDLLV